MENENMHNVTIANAGSKGLFSRYGQIFFSQKAILLDLPTLYFLHQFAKIDHNKKHWLVDKDATSTKGQYTWLHDIM
jgi:hypothetical protein